MKKTRLIALVMVALMLAAVMTGCAKSGNQNNGNASGDPIKVGVIAPLTGDVAVYGTAVKNAVELYVKNFNAAGGVKGRPIKLIIYDDKGDATESVNAYNKLVSSDEVVAIIGAVTSTPTLAVCKASQEDGIPVITATATHIDVTKQGPNIFRACFIDKLQGISMANLASKGLSAKKAAIIYNQSDAYSTGLMQDFTDEAKNLGLTVTATEAYNAKDVDFKAQLNNIIATSPDAIFMPDYYNTVYMIASQARELGYKGKLLGVDGVDGILTIEGANKAVLNDLYFSNHYDANDTAEVVKNFRAAFEADYKEVPNALAALGYDAANILCNAIAKTVEGGKNPDNTKEFYDAVIAQVYKTDLTCVTGHITFGEDRNPVKTCAIIQIVDGAYKFYGLY